MTKNMNFDVIGGLHLHREIMTTITAAIESKNFGVESCETNNCTLSVPLLPCAHSS